MALANWLETTSSPIPTLRKLAMKQIEQMKIIQAPNKILKKKSKLVEKIDHSILKLIEEMWQTLAGVKGVGLAAPQIDKSVSLAIIGFEPTDEMLKKDPKLQQKVLPRIVFINPKIVWNSQEKSIEKEGCLSCDKIEIDVPRFKKIHVEFKDEKLKRKKIKARGYLARVIQHEIDHLNGVLITDYRN
jgi:peptide deformylase